MKFNLRSILRCLFALAVVLSLAQPAALFAEDLPVVVTKTNDDGSEGTLRWAIAQASVYGYSNTITFAGGLTIYLESKINITDEITLQGNGTSQTIIDGSSGGTYSSCFLVGGSHSLICKNLTIRNCKYGASSGYDEGGAIYMSPGSFLTLDSCQILNCRASTYGGAVYVGAGATLNIDFSTFSGNEAGERGGAIYNNDGSLQISNASFYNNRVTGSSTVGGYGHSGGAIFSNLNPSSEEEVSIRFSTFEENFSRTANDGYGGAFYSLNYSDNNVDIAYSTFSGNSAFKGGAVYANGWLNIDKSTFSSNRATEEYIDSAEGAADGGALFMNLSGTFNIWNSTFSGNQADGSGGAIFDGSTVSVNNDPSFALSYVTITLNQADADNDGGGVGGGVYQDHAELSCINTIIAGNLDQSPGFLALNYPDLWGTLTSAGYNLIGIFQKGSFASIEGDETGNLYGSGSEPLNPRLGPLGKGASDVTETHPLLVDSPAIDNGCGQDVFGNDIDLDQREAERPKNGHACRDEANDIGAYELISDLCENDTIMIYAADGVNYLDSKHNLTDAVDDIYYDYAPGTYVLKCREGWSSYDVNIDVGDGHEVVLSGGYSCDRSEKLGTSYIKQLSGYAVTIASGTVVFEDFVLQ